MSENKDVIITEYSNVTKEGVLLHLNKNAKLKRGNMYCNEFWVSWDKIGDALFEAYTDSTEVSHLNEIRKTDDRPKSSVVDYTFKQLDEKFSILDKETKDWLKQTILYHIAESYEKGKLIK